MVESAKALRVRYAPVLTRDAERTRVRLTT